MDGFELNKTLAAVLFALLVSMVSGMVGEGLVSPQMLKENAFPIEGVELAAASPDSSAEAELAPIEPLLAAADIEAGKKVAKKCLQCHTFEQGGPHKIGPNLFKVINAKIAGIADYAYSGAFKALEGKWTVEDLNKFLHKPRKYAKGTKMSFAGLKKDKDRANLIAYMKTQA